MLGRAQRSTAQRGDTIVEVLFAITVFSMVAVASIAIMNSGLAMSQRSLEITAVRQQIDGQAEALRFLHGSYIENYAVGGTYTPNSPAGQYNAILASRTVESATPFNNLSTCPTAAALRSKQFVVNTQSGRLETAASIPSPAETSAQLIYNQDSARSLKAAEGIWVEAVRSPATAANGGVAFMDFHIRACWDAPGQTVPLTLGTIVRLYDPN